MTTTGTAGPKRGRGPLRTATDVVGAAMIVSGAVLAGISFGQHEHHDHALAAYKARIAQIDRAAAAEAQRSRPTVVNHDATRTQADASSNQAPSNQAPSNHPPSTQAPTTQAKQPGRAAVLAAARRAADEAAAKATEKAQAAKAAQEAQATQQAQAVQRRAQAAKKAQAALKAQPASNRPASVTRQGSVSEIRGSGATLVIPALGVHAPVVATGAVNGSMTIPGDVHTVGWYDGIDTNDGQTVNYHEPWPGQPGVSLLAGHINWVGQGPGALYYIGHLVVGDPVEVIGSNGVTSHWSVSEAPITIAKANLPANLFNNTGPPKLAMVTCGGPYDSTTHHYLDNVVVWATPASH